MTSKSTPPGDDNFCDETSLARSRSRKRARYTTVVPPPHGHPLLPFAVRAGFVRVINTTRTRQWHTLMKTVTVTDSCPPAAAVLAATRCGTKIDQSWPDRHHVRQRYLVRSIPGQTLERFLIASRLALKRTRATCPYPDNHLPGKNVVTRNTTLV